VTHWCGSAPLKEPEQEIEEEQHTEIRGLVFHSKLGAWAEQTSSKSGLSIGLSKEQTLPRGQGPTGLPMSGQD
jgi:hypothetical protein